MLSLREGRDIKTLVLPGLVGKRHKFTGFCWNSFSPISYDHPYLP